MKCLIILLLLINVSIALKRKRRTRGSGNIVVARVAIAALSRPITVIKQPTPLTFEYNESTIVIENFFSIANFETQPNPIINVPKASKYTDLILSTNLCTNNFDMCFISVSPLELHAYKFAFGEVNDTLIQIRSTILEKRRKMMLIINEKEKFSENEILNFNKMSEFFYSLSLYHTAFGDIWKQYEFIMANKFPIDEAFFKSDELIEIDQDMKMYFKDHAEEIVKIIKSPDYDIAKVKTAIFKRWNNEWIKYRQLNMEYENHEDCALYSWVLVHHFVEDLEKKEQGGKIYHFVLDIIMIGHKAKSIDKNMTLILNVDFPKERVKEMEYDVGLKQLVKMDSFKNSYKANLIKLIWPQVEILKEAAELGIKGIVKHPGNEILI
jgi:hypothetical protein